MGERVCFLFAFEGYREKYSGKANDENSRLCYNLTRNLQYGEREKNK